MAGELQETELGEITNGVACAEMYQINEIINEHIPLWERYLHLGW